MKMYYSDIKISFAGNGMKAKSVEDYKQKIKIDFYDEFGFQLEDEEIQNIQEHK
jgi:hypothetical protein